MIIKKKINTKSLPHPSPIPVRHRPAELTSQPMRPADLYSSWIIMTLIDSHWPRLQYLSGARHQLSVRVKNRTYGREGSSVR